MGLFNALLAQSHAPGLWPSQLSKLNGFLPLDGLAAVPPWMAHQGVGVASISRRVGAELLITNLSMSHRLLELCVVGGRDREDKT